MDLVWCGCGLVVLVMVVVVELVWCDYDIVLLYVNDFNICVLCIYWRVGFEWIGIMVIFFY